jgi:2-phospho-L-lactate guanylyltransferase (CobY/MobA/RfbA family)
MKQSIQERMNNQIAKATAYNTLFDIVVCTSEESLSTQSVNTTENQYIINTQSLNVIIICNDNDWNTITVSIDIPTLESARVADIQINIMGQLEEDYHNIPRSIRTQIFNLVDDIYEAVQGWVDENSNT